MPILSKKNREFNPITLEDVSSTGKRRPWRVHKQNADALADVYERIGKEKKAERVRNCGEVLKFAVCPEGHEKKLKHANFCRVRLCTMCAWRRSLKIGAQVHKIAHIAAQSHNLRWIFLTLTIRNVEGYELPDALDRFIAAWKRLTNNTPWKQSVLGFFRALEVTRNGKIYITKEMVKENPKLYKRLGLKVGDKNPFYNTYHPHFHVVLAVPPSYFGKQYIKTAEWVQMWREALRVDYDPVVDVRTVKKKGNPENVAELGEMEVGESEVLPGKAVAEMSKYVTKPEDYLDDDDPDPSRIDEAVQILDASLRGRRLIAYGGILKDIYEYLKRNGDVEDAESDHADLVRVGDEDDLNTCNCSVCGSTFREEIYRWLPDRKNYILF